MFPSNAGPLKPTSRRIILSFAHWNCGENYDVRYMCKLHFKVHVPLSM